MKNYGQIIEQVSIIAMAAEGKCVAKVDGMVIFVHGVAPGDVADIKLIKRDKKFYEAVPVHFHSYSDLRSEPFCAHFGVCGGCKWQHLGYETQLSFKHKQVKDALERIAKVPIPDINPILSSKDTTFYRNKLEYTFSNQRWFENSEREVEHKENNGLGFHIPGRFDKILNIEKCYLQADPSNAIRNGLNAFCLRNGFGFFDIRKQEGLMRNLIIRISSTGEVMVIVQFYYEDLQAIDLIMNYLKNEFPQITSLLYVVNSKGNETIFDQNIITFHGK
ncbi:MAG: class I SAM-dependent RNA methyltransferase, partial [Cytophagales bacterium]